MHTDTEMDDGDGKAPEVDLAREEALLTRKLRLLEDFTKKELPGTLPPLEERLRSLQQAIQSREAVITRAGKTNSARKYLEEASEVTPREEFLAGIISHDDFASFTLVSEQGHPTRIGLADNGLPAPNPSLSSILVPGGFFSEDSPSDASLQGSSRSRPRESINSADKERAPCLRCKILKRKCDSLEKCSLCPQQSYENENDYWKVIGCFRGGLRDLAPLLLPPNTRWTNRSYSFPPGPPQSFQVFLRSKRNFDAVKHYVGHMYRTCPEFASLKDSSWAADDVRIQLSHAAVSTSVSSSISRRTDHMLECFEAPWSLLRIVRRDVAYQGKSGYNLFTLLRLGTLFANTMPDDWAIYIQAARLLCGAVDFYLAERDIFDWVKSQSPQLIGQGPSYSFPVVYIMDDLGRFLHCFEDACSGRGKLTGQKLLACFYTVLLLSIVKSLLIDARSLRGRCGVAGLWSNADAVRINSIYKALVGVFCWSSKSDLMVDNIPVGLDPSIQKAILDTKIMVRTQEWTTWGMKGSKEFLTALGSGLLPDGVFNGFFIQSFGLDKLKPMVPKKSSETGSSSIADPAVTWPSIEQRSLAATSSTTQGDSGSSAFQPMVSVFAPFVASASTNFAIIIPKDPQLASDVGWEHISADQNGVSVASSEQSARRRSGMRTAKLDPKTKEKALRIRRIRACWNCWIQKVPCSEDLVCDRCTRENSVVSDCVRMSFVELEPIFFPEYMFSTLRKSRIEDCITKNISRFLDTTFDIVVTFDGVCSIEFSVNQFESTTLALLHSYSRPQDGELRDIWSAPIAVMALSINKMRKLFRKYVDEVLHSLAAKASLEAEPREAVAVEVVNILMRLAQNESVDNLSKDWSKVYLIIKFFNRIPVITQPSALELFERFAVTHLTGPWAVSSRLLDLQLKYVLSKVMRESILGALQGLERSLRSRTKDSWPLSFSAILWLCLCIEELQIAAVRAGTDLIMIDEEPTPSNEDVLQACQGLEGHTFKLIKELFHGIYRTTTNESGKAYRGFNPIKKMLTSLDPIFGSGNPAEDMIREICQLMKRSKNQLQELHKPLSIEDDDDEFAKRNRGRLIAAFLLSFVDSGELRNI